VFASFGLNEFAFTSFQRKKEPGIAKKVRAELRKVPPALIDWRRALPRRDTPVEARSFNQ
jgi:hypothetical protein